MTPNVAHQDENDSMSEEIKPEHENLLEERLKWTSLVLEQDILGIRPSHLKTVYGQGQSTPLRRSRIDWDRFLDVFEEGGSGMQQHLAEFRHDSINGYLLHLVCASAAPVDVMEIVLQASTLPIDQPCGLGLAATPLHLACFFGCPAASVDALLHADVNGTTLCTKDAHGRLPLHLACMMGKTTESIQVVTILLAHDATKQCLGCKDGHGATPLQIASERANQDVLALLLDAYLQADAMTENEYAVGDIPKQLPLHRAFHRSSNLSGNIVRTLAQSPSASPILHTKDRRGQTPIHVACQYGAGRDAFQQLIDNDHSGETFRATDAYHQTPSDLIIKLINDNDTLALQTLNDIAAADQSRRFFAVQDGLGLTMLDKLLKSWPQKDAMALSSTQRNALLILIACTPPGSGRYALSLGNSKTLLPPHVFERVYMDRRFHTTLNNLMCRRSFTFYFMVDLYVRILLVIFFTIATNRAVVQYRNDLGPYIMFYLCASYLLVWQLKLAWYHQLYYLQEVWNILDLVTNILVVASVASLQSGQANTGGWRALNVVAGGLLWAVVVTAALRSTFKHFAIFVSGFTTIMIYMIPFGTTLFLMLGSFAEMYFKSSFGTPICTKDVDANDFCSYDSSFLKVYTMFVAGIDGSLLTPETDYNLLILTVFYGFLFAIVMLNVLVAVIFMAWDAVTPRGEQLFWQYRHQFLMETTETSYLAVYQGWIQSQALDRLANHVVNVQERFKSRPERLSGMNAVGSQLQETLLYLVEGIYLGLWMLAGALSAGLLWPKSFRKAIFSIGDPDPDDDAMEGAASPSAQEKQREQATAKLSEARADLEEATEALAVSQTQLGEVKAAVERLEALVLELRDHLNKS